MPRTREEILREIAVIFTDWNNGPGESWDSDSITEHVCRLLREEGAFDECEDCGELYPAHYDECPWSDQHEEECEYCGYHDCECQYCQHCGAKQDDCECPEEEAVYG